MFAAALLYVCQIAKEEQTLHTYLKKGWEGTHHHDNTGRSRTYTIKKMEAMLCILASHPHADSKSIHLCTLTQMLTRARMTHAHTLIHTPAHT